MWIDGLQNQVCVRVKALPEIGRYLESLDIVDDIHDSRYIMCDYIRKMINFHGIDNEDREDFCEEDCDLWEFMEGLCFTMMNIDTSQFRYSHIYNLQWYQGSYFILCYL